MVHVGAGGTGPPSACGYDARRLGPILERVLAAEPSTVVVDLGGDPHVDTALIAVLIDARRRAWQSGPELLVRGSPAVRQLAEICRVEGILSLAGP